jgi:hypothetical protein
VSVIRVGGGLGAPRTATTGRSSYSAGISGNSDAMCPSGPTPSRQTSNVGAGPWSSGRAARASSSRSARPRPPGRRRPARRTRAWGGHARGRPERRPAALRGPASRCAPRRRRAGSARRPTTRPAAASRRRPVPASRRWLAACDGRYHPRSARPRPRHVPTARRPAG